MIADALLIICIGALIGVWRARPRPPRLRRFDEVRRWTR